MRGALLLALGPAAACECPTSETPMTVTRNLAGNAAAQYGTTAGAQDLSDCEVICTSGQVAPGASAQGGGYAELDGCALEEVREVTPDVASSVCTVIEPCWVAHCDYTQHTSCDGVGRPPAGVVALVTTGDRRADHLRDAVRLEAASARAFDRLAQQLSRAGAPSRLVRRCQRAAQDERRHARQVRRLGGARAPVPTVPAWPSLDALAQANAVEGLVLETWGAAVLSWQAERATDLEARRVFARIARDERAHAGLSRALDGWARTRVAGQALDQAREAAIAALRARVFASRDGGHAGLGLPTALQQRVLFSQLFG